MIVYENRDRRYTGSGMDEVYAGNLQQYTHDKQIEALADRMSDLAEESLLSAPLTCLDIGCGQGQMLHLIYEMFRGQDGFDVEKAGFYGLDVSRVGIEQAEKNFPDHSWIIDTFQEFAEDSAERLSLKGEFTLVTNRGGLTAVESMQEYSEALAQVYALMRGDGLYFLSQSKGYYQIWANQVYSKQEASGTGLRSDIFDIARQTFEEVECVELPGDYMLFCRKREGRGHTSLPRSDKPWAVNFKLNNGAKPAYYVSGDAISAPYLRHTLAQLNLKKPIRAYDIPQIYPPGRFEKEEAFQSLCQAKWHDGNPSVLFFGNQIRQSSGHAVPVQEIILDTLGRDYNALYYPRVLPCVRDYCRFFPDWISSEPQVALLGIGLEDHKVHIDEAQGPHPLVDRFEFANRLNWLLDTLKRLNIQPVWLSSRLMADVAFPDKRFRNDQPEARAFSLIEQQACATHEVPWIALPDAGFESPKTIRVSTIGCLRKLLGGDRPKLPEGIKSSLKRMFKQLTTGQPTLADPEPLANEQDALRDYMFSTENKLDGLQQYHLPEAAELLLSDSLTAPVNIERATLLYFSAPEIIYNDHLNNGVYDVQLINGVDMWSRSAQFMLLRHLASKYDPAKPNVMVLGDSTRMRARDLTGYGLPAYMALLPHANIIHVPNNFGGSMRQLEVFPSLAEHMRPDVVHMNAGLHDLMVNRRTGKYHSYQTIDDYRENVRRWIKAVQEMPSHPQVIWGTCTPILEKWHSKKPDGKPSDWHRNQEDIVQYNAAASAVAADLHAPVNDLFGTVIAAGLERCILRDGVHLSTAGSQICGMAVAKAVRKAIVGV